jgi:hypothetical protein
MRVGTGLGTGEALLEELTGYAEHLATFLGGEYPSIGSTLDLLEVSTAYLARAYDIERRLYEREQKGNLPRGCPEQRFRTGPLGSFIEQAKVCRDLGSRRLTFAQLQYDSEKTGRDQ